MTVSRTDIERALSEIIACEEGKRFQALAVVLTKQKYPDLVASEYHKDLGLDAYASPTVAPDRVGRGVASSITGTLDKIADDARKVKSNFPKLTVLIFVTPVSVTNYTKEKWATEIYKEFGYELIVMSREDVITSLMLPCNVSVCRTLLGIRVAVDVTDEALLERLREAVTEEAANWRAHSRIGDRPFIPLLAAPLDADDKEIGETLDFAGIQAALEEGRRITLEAAGGGGKTTTLLELAAESGRAGKLAFLIDLPIWVRSGLDLLDFIARMPSLQSHNITAADLARLSRVEHFSFLLNGWNEIAGIYSQDAIAALAQLERSFPAAGIIVATRTHFIAPPLPGAIRARLRLLTRGQRAEYLRGVLGDRAEELRRQLESNDALDALTRTPFILSEVTTIFQSGRPIPTTRGGVLDAVLKLIEQTEAHRGHLQAPPLDGAAPRYLTRLASEMTNRGEVNIEEAPARAIISAVARQLQQAGQLGELPAPAAILGALCAHHVLERLYYPTTAFRFQHQQFQEFYAAQSLHDVLFEPGQVRDQAHDRAFAVNYLNKPMWEEPLYMVAEEIATQIVEDRDHGHALDAGRRIIRLALTVDPVLAAELSQLCGASVWDVVRASVGECLRAWYAANDTHHKQCALAAMLATGSSDFTDILVPLLTHDDQQIRLATYRAGRSFDPSSLGTDWRRVVDGWNEACRADFVGEVVHRGRMSDVGESFASTDPSNLVRVEAIQELSWIGDMDGLTRVLDAYDDASLDAVLPHLYPEMTPPTLRDRVIAANRRLLEAQSEPLARLRQAIVASEFDDNDAASLIKTELVQLSPGRFDQYAAHAIETALGIVKKTEPRWVSDWVIPRLLGGSLWGDQWHHMLADIPPAQIDALFTRITTEELELREASAMRAILCVSPTPALARTLFSKFSDEFKLAAASGPGRIAAHTLCEQQRNLFRALPIEVAITGLLEAASPSFDPGQFRAVIDIFGRVALNAPELRGSVPDALRRPLRNLLKTGIDHMLRNGGFDAEAKVRAAVALGRIGETEDVAELRNLIAADIAGPRTGMVTYANVYVEALLWLDAPEIETPLLDLLRQPGYEEHAARALLRLAVPPQRRKEMLAPPKLDCERIWKARSGAASGFEEARATRYAAAIRQRISDLMQERASAAQPDLLNPRLKTIAALLAKLDGQGSAALILSVLALPGQRDGYTRVWGLQGLLSAGALLTTDAMMEVLDPTIDHLLAQGLYNDQNLTLLTDCLRLLPFGDDPAKAVHRIEQVLSSFESRAYQFRELVEALGHSRADAAVDFLLAFARQPGGVQNMEDVWIDALGRLGTATARRALLSFIDPDIPWIGVPINVDFRNTDHFAPPVTNWAREDADLKGRLFALCDAALSPTQRLLLSAIINALGTGEALLAGIGLLNDRQSPNVPYDLARGLDGLFLERRPYGDMSNAFVYEPRRADEIRAKLFQMVLTDQGRRRIAFSTLGQIEVWRIEYGRPNNEPHHPMIESGEPWPPIAVIQQNKL